jgi:hypothetical protein
MMQVRSFKVADNYYMCARILKILKIKKLEYANS